MGLIQVERAEQRQTGPRLLNDGAEAGGSEVPTVVSGRIGPRMI